MWRLLLGALVIVIGTAAKPAAPVSAPVAGTETSAAQPTALPSDARPQDVAPFVARISDVEARRLLLEELNRRAVDKAADADDAPSEQTMAQLLKRIRVESAFAAGRVATVFGGALYLLGVPSFVFDHLTDGQDLADLLTPVGIAFAAAIAVELLFRRATRTARRRIQAVAATGLGERLGRLALSVGVEVLAVIVFALVAFGAYFGFEQRSERADLLFTTVALGVLIVRGVAALTRSLLAVGAPALRVVPLTDGTAAAAHRWAVALAVVVGVGTTLLAQLSAFELYMDVYLLVLAVVALAIALMIAAMIVRVRRPVARVLAGSGGIVGDLADRWHRFAVAYVLIIWALWIVHVIAECDTKVSAIVASAAIVIAAGGLDRFVHRRLDVYRAGAAGGAMGVAEHAARALVAVVAVMAFAVAWGFDPRNLAHGSGWGVVAAALFNITVAVLLAWLGWALIKVSLDRHLVPTATIGEDASIAGRTQTLLPLVRHFILTVLVVLTTLIVLSSLGVDIGPLLAGAGIVGLAIGFGAQTLVRDIVAGIFFLVDDAFRIGEYVEAGDRRGTVEGMSVRSLRLRHHRGAVHTIPFGELRSLTNHSRDWVIFKLELRLPFDADVVKARKLIKQVGQDMLNDEELGPLFLQPLKSQGVTKMDATAMVMAVKFMCRPNEQWAIRREAYVRIQAAFAANGIVFATQHITVRVPGGASERDVAAGTALVVAGD